MPSRWSSSASCRSERRLSCSGTACSPKSTRASLARSTTSSFAASAGLVPCAGGAPSSMRELLREVMEGREAWIVGGAVRDEILGRAVVDVDVACRDPEPAAREFARRSGGAPFPLSERHGAWRVAFADGQTVDFTPLPHGVEADLLTR